MDKVDINPTRSITTLNIIALKALIKRPEIVRVDQKIRPHHMLSRWNLLWFLKNFIGVELIYNVVLVSDVQQSYSCTYIHSF